MHPTSDSQCLIEEIDARQNDVLAQLDELNEKIELLLNEVRPPATELESGTSATAESAGPTGHVNPADPADPISQSPAAA